MVDSFVLCLIVVDPSILSFYHIVKVFFLFKLDVYTFLTWFQQSPGYVVSVLQKFEVRNNCSKCGTRM